jgi:hypothetical protein
MVQQVGVTKSQEQECVGQKTDGRDRIEANEEKACVVDSEMDALVSRRTKKRNALVNRQVNGIVSRQMKNRNAVVKRQMNRLV